LQNRCLKRKAALETIEPVEVVHSGTWNETRPVFICTNGGLDKPFGAVLAWRMVVGSPSVIIDLKKERGQAAN